MDKIKSRQRIKVQKKIEKRNSQKFKNLAETARCTKLIVVHITANEDKNEQELHGKLDLKQSFFKVY